MDVITNKIIGLKCLIETKIQLLYDHVDHTRFPTAEMGCQVVRFGTILDQQCWGVTLTTALENIVEICLVSSKT